MEAKRGARTAMAAAAVALMVASGLTACSSSKSSSTPSAGTTASGAVGAPVATSGASTGGSTAGSAADSAAGGDSAKAFCEDVRNLDGVAPPNVGAAVPPGTVAVFDRMAGEAPGPVKTAMKAAAAAVHGMSGSGKVNPAGLTALGTAMKTVTDWARDTAHCPVS